MVTYNQRKTFIIRESGRSTDFISPSFGFGCLYNCTYCYLKRHTNDNSLNVAKNPNDILTAINDHVIWLPPKEPNQTDPVYYTYDLGCNEDFALHAKFHEWRYIFDFFKEHPKAKASFATKYVNNTLLTYNPEGKVRIRFSLMPQSISSILEPHTSTIQSRIDAIDRFVNAGYDVHINFSPIVVYPGWLVAYELLFHQLNKIKHKDKVLCECIFLTHNAKKHQFNMAANLPGENLLWTPENQEGKISQYGGSNLRYNHIKKRQYIAEFTEIHDKIIPWNTIRYIF